MTALVALFSINIKVIQRIMNIIIAQKIIGANVSNAHVIAIIF